MPTSLLELRRVKSKVPWTFPDPTPTLHRIKHNGTFGIKTRNKEESEQFGSSPVLGVFSEL
ncbi:hypothetical protein LINGRAHAP2_LOCUS22354 [Linum grandiflorum]